MNVFCEGEKSCTLHSCNLSALFIFVYLKSASYTLFLTIRIVKLENIVYDFPKTICYGPIVGEKGTWRNGAGYGLICILGDMAYTFWLISQDWPRSQACHWWRWPSRLIACLRSGSAASWQSTLLSVGIFLSKQTSRFKFIYSIKKGDSTSIIACFNI